MKYFQNGSEIEITGPDSFDLVQTFECGQCFRWNRLPPLDGTNTGSPDITYHGVALGKPLRIRQEKSSVFVGCSMDDFETTWRGYFDIDRNYAAIREALCVDAYMTEAALCSAGIRILKQDKWEALCSFILSQCNNIPRIKQIIEKFCMLFGEPLVQDGITYYAFPSAEKTAGLTAADLAPLRCGYRAPYIIGAARALHTGNLDLEALAAGTPDNAVKELKKLSGVGDKVANCAVLFGLHMLDAFPIDTWMKRAIADHYGDSFDPTVFSPYAGIAQQYMFYHARISGREAG